MYTQTCVLAEICDAETSQNIQSAKSTWRKRCRKNQDQRSTIPNELAHKGTVTSSHLINSNHLAWPNLEELLKIIQATPDGAKVVKKIVNQNSFFPIALFLGYGHEPDTWPLIKQIQAANNPVWVPAPGENIKNPQENWVELSPDIPAISHSSFCANPPGRIVSSAELKKCEVILLPALAVDAGGTRLGQGGGWYDRNLIKFKKALKIAVLDKANFWPKNTLPKSEHDQPIDVAWTQLGYYFCPIRT